MSNLKLSDPDSNPRKDILVIKCLFQMEDLKVQEWYKYVFGQFFGERVYCGGGALVVFKDLGQNMTKL